MRQFVLSLALTLPFAAGAQQVSLQMGENWAELPMEQTQSELKPGWTIADVKLKDKLSHYLNGRHARQIADDNMPVLLITPAEHETLADYALIRLQGKRTFRKLAKPQLGQDDYQRIEPGHFEITSDGKEGFICKPRTPLRRGDYIVVNLSQKPIGDLGDYRVFAFYVEMAE